MSDLGLMFRHGLRMRVERAAAIAEQATVGPVLLRTVVVVASLAAYAVTWPIHDFALGTAIVAIVLSLGTGLAPRSFITTLSIIAMVLGYLVNVYDHGGLTVWRPLVAAALIYIVHAGAAFAAALPFNAVATRGLFGPFVLRVAAVIAVTVVLGLGVLAVPNLVGSHRLVSAAVAGMIAMVGVAAYVAYLGSRRP
jgi:hypothetical protein